MLASNDEVGFVVKSAPRSHLRLMEQTLRRRLGIRIRAARLEAELSQEALAACIKRTPESVSNIERGAQLPAIDTLIALSSVLQLSLSDLLKNVDDARPLSAERARNEARLEGAIRSLSDEAVAIAVQQVEALKRLR